MNKFYLDTEFIDLGERVHLLSIGIAHQSGSTYYAESSETDHSLACDWVTENVLPFLRKGYAKTHLHIASEIEFFVNHHNRSDEAPSFYGWYSAYDWYLLCSLFGGMLKIPENWPRYCRDVKQISDEANIENLPPVDGNEHHALYDAIWIKEAHEFILRERANPPVPIVTEEAIHRYHTIHLPKINTASWELSELAHAMNQAIEETQKCTGCGKAHGRHRCVRRSPHESTCVVSQ